MSILRSPPYEGSRIRGGSQPDLSTLATADQQMFDQQVTLRKRKQPGDSDSDIKEDLASFRMEIMSFFAKFEASQRQELQDFRTEIKEQIDSVKNLAVTLTEEHDRMKHGLSVIEERVLSVENQISTLTSLPKNLDEANEVIKNLKAESNVNRQFSMLNNIEISGVPFVKGENLMTIFRNICTRVGFELANSDIDTIHRVRRFQNEEHNTSRPPAIIVRLTQRRRKNELLAAIRARRGLTTVDLDLQGPASSVYVGDLLTPTNKLLLKRARQLKVEYNYDYVWVRDCKIFMRKNDKSKIIYINNESDLSKVK